MVTIMDAHAANQLLTDTRDRLGLRKKGQGIVVLVVKF